MWLVTKIGFFNIIQYPEDKEEDLLTVKARSREDLENFNGFLPPLGWGRIEESSEADYRFRMKLPRQDAAYVLGCLVDCIDYRLTKPAISEHFPERSRIYFNVWDTLYQIQELHAEKAPNPR